MSITRRFLYKLSKISSNLSLDYLRKYCDCTSTALQNISQEQSSKYLCSVIEASTKTAENITRTNDHHAFTKVWNSIVSIGKDVSVSIKDIPTDFGYGILLYEIVAKLTINKNNPFILEFGTGRGFSSLVMSKALQDCHCQGSILTIDIIHHQTKYNWRSPIPGHNGKSRKDILNKYSDLTKIISFVSLPSSIFTSTIFLQSIDLAFIDAAHTSSEVMRELQYVMERQSSGGIIILDDFNFKDYPSLAEIKLFVENDSRYTCQMIKCGIKGEICVLERVS